MDAGTQSEFNDLCFHWDEVYEIKFDEGAGIWSAGYRGSSNLMGHDTVSA